MRVGKEGIYEGEEGVMFYPISVHYYPHIACGAVCLVRHQNREGESEVGESEWESRRTDGELGGLVPSPFSATAEGGAALIFGQQGWGRPAISRQEEGGGS